MDKPGERQRDLLFSAALFVVALLPRLYVAIAWAREPVWDGHYYDFGARRIAEGFGYSDDVIPKRFPLALLVPYITTLEERND